jgi:hypothetical protein
VCSVTVMSLETHNSIASGLQATLEELISKSPTISQGRPGEGLELRIVGAPAHDISHYPEFPHRTKQRPTDDPRFTAFYVIVSPDGHLVSANYQKCTEHGHECSRQIVHELEGMCRRMSNNSFKPTPLRGAA